MGSNESNSHLVNLVICITLNYECVGESEIKSGIENLLSSEFNLLWVQITKIVMHLRITEEISRLHT